MKQLIVDELKNAHQMSTAEADRALKAVSSSVLAVAKTHGSARIPEFGTFSVKRRAERMSRNPRTGEPIKVGAKDAFTFKASKGVV